MDDDDITIHKFRFWRHFLPFLKFAYQSDDVTKLFSSSLSRNKKFMLDQMALQNYTFSPLINALVYSLGY